MIWGDILQTSPFSIQQAVSFRIDEIPLILMLGKLAKTSRENNYVKCEYLAKFWSHGSYFCQMQYIIHYFLYNLLDIIMMFCRRTQRVAIGILNFIWTSSALWILSKTKKFDSYEIKQSHCGANYTCNNKISKLLLPYVLKVSNI